MQRDEELEAQAGVIVAFRCPTALAEAAERVAASEGLSRSDIARRALLRDRRVRAAMAGSAA
jgi:hypothetical protein